MRFIRYDDDRLGLLDDGEGVIDLTDRLGLRSNDPLKEYIRSDHDAGEYSGEDPDHALDDVRVEAPIREPGKVIAAPRNYRKHAAEMGAGTAPYEQAYFLKSPSSVSGPEDPVELPFSDRRCDHEIELAAIMGDTVKDVDATDVWDHFFGYTLLLDISVRGDRDRSERKSYDTFTPMGPVVVTPDEIEDPLDLDMTLEVNDERRQDSNTGSMVFRPHEIVQYASIGSTIAAGDVVATGTPEGVGRLRGGDVVTATLEGVGTMELPVEERSDRFEDRVIDPR